MDGVLLIDKPAGPTSHDVVARMRRVTGERRIGHAGTLDPMATGLLVLLIGRATRLAPWLSGSDKTYDAIIQLGVATDTDDALGQPVGPPVTVHMDEAAVDAALAGFHGTFEQLPPSHSAKKIAGARAYDLARRAKPVALKPVAVTVRDLQRLSPLSHDGRFDVRVTAGAGFYVRALARDVGQVLGCGGHLTALRRVKSGSFDVADAVALEDAERLGAGVSTRLIAPPDALPGLVEARLNEAGLKRAVHGNALSPEHLAGGPVAPGGDPERPVKVLAPDGRLVALAEARQGILHPVVVLG